MQRQGAAKLQGAAVNAVLTGQINAAKNPFVALQFTQRITPNAGTRVFERGVAAFQKGSRKISHRLGHLRVFGHQRRSHLEVNQPFSQGAHPRIAHALPQHGVTQHTGVPGNDRVRAVPQQVFHDLGLADVLHGFDLTQTFQQVAAALCIQRHVRLAVKQNQVQLAKGIARLGKGPKTSDQTLVLWCRHFRRSFTGQWLLVQAVLENLRLDTQLPHQCVVGNLRDDSTDHRFCKMGVIKNFLRNLRRHQLGQLGFNVTPYKICSAHLIQHRQNRQFTPASLVAADQSPGYHVRLIANGRFGQAQPDDFRHVVHADHRFGVVQVDHGQVIDGLVE